MRNILALLLWGAEVCSYAGVDEWTRLGPQGGHIQAISMDPHNPGTLYAETNIAPFKTSDAGGTWVKSNLPNQPLVFDPQDPNTIYTFSQTAGVSKSTDGGKSWNAANSGLPPSGYYPPQVLALVIDPVNSAALYAGTWQGIFKSTDGGANWNSANSGIPVLNVPGQSPGLDSGKPTSVYCLAIDPRTPSTLYAVANGITYAPDTVLVAGGLFKSTDEGGTWNPLNLGLPQGSSIHVIAINPQNPSTLYLGTVYGILKSTDRGSDWSPVNSGLPAFAGPPGGATVDSLAIDQQQPDTVYAAITSPSGNKIVKTTNGGASWNDASSGLPEFAAVSVGPTLRSLLIDPQIGTTLYVGTGAGVFKSTDGGATWAAVNSGLTSTVITDLAIAGDSNTLYAVTSIGLVKTTDGRTWSSADSGLPRVSSPLAIDPQNPSTIFAIGTLMATSTYGIVKSADGGATWGMSQILQDPGITWVTTLTIDPLNSNIVYATSQGFDECGGETLYKSVDGGMSWSQSLFSNIGVAAGCILSLAVDPRNTNHLYAAFQRGGVFKSMDAGATWNAANSGLPASVWPLWMPDAEALAIDPGSPGTIYAVSSSGIFKSSDGATSWNPTGSGLPDLSGSAGDCCFRPLLAVDPQNSASVYLGLPINGAHHVFQSSDGGASWIDSLAVAGCCGWFGGLAISSQGPGAVYAGSPGEGVFEFRKSARPTKSSSR